MNRSLEVLKTIYKPYRYTIKGNVTILETTSGNFVIKEAKNNLPELFDYLKSRNFDNYPNIIDSSRAGINVFKYIEGVKMPVEQKAHDLIATISNLHNKTIYFKDVTNDTFQKVYDNINSNINYLSNKYDDCYNKFFAEVMMAPSHYLFMRNYSKIKADLKFCQDELANWYDLVKDTNRIRVATIHNNLNLDHFIESEKNYLISWDHATIDSPVLDLVNFYHEEYLDLNFEDLLNTYFNNFNLTPSEKKLLFVNLALPQDFTINNNEFNNCLNVQKFLDYIYKTESLIRPYYTEKQEEK
jgi:thiamine kinase-like enzyme